MTKPHQKLVVWFFVLLLFAAYLSWIVHAGWRYRENSPCANGQCQDNTTNPNIEVPIESKEDVKPSVEINPKEITLEFGESFTLTYTTKNAEKCVLGAMDKNRESTLTDLPLNGSVQLKPTSSTFYRLFVKRGLHTAHADCEATVKKMPLFPGPASFPPEPTSPDTALRPNIVQQ